jgi:CRISPR-associated protein Cas2
MRHRYLVAYDISDPKRLKRTYRKMNGFGDPVQYSVFQCDLSDVERTLMKEAIGAIINHAEDRVMIADIGPLDGRGAVAFEFLGVQLARPAEASAVIV